MGIILDTGIKAGNRKGRLNYPAEFKRQLAEQACVPGVSFAWIALEHCLNANMVHKWRREYLAGVLSQHKGTIPQAAFLPILVQAKANPVSPVAIIPTSSIAAQLPTPATAGNSGVIEVRMGMTVVRLEGVVDVKVLGAVLRHFHP